MASSKTGLFLFLSAFVLFTSSAQAANPSFDCSKAGVIDEKLICSDDGLAGLDKQLGELYFNVRNSMGASLQSKLLSEQRKWLKSRLSSCSISVDVSENEEQKRQAIVCLKQYYLNRIVKLGELSFDIELDSTNFHADRDLPLACLKFNEKLRNPQALPLNDYVDVQNINDFDVTIQGRELCVLGVRHGQLTEVTVRKGLTSVDGDVLQSDIVHSFHISDRKPSIQISQNAYILPRRFNPTIPVTTINLSRLDLELIRMDERNLADVVARGQIGKSLNYYALRYLTNEEGEVHWKGQVDVVDQPNRKTTTLVPFDEMVTNPDPGIYALVIREGGSQPRRHKQQKVQWVVVTNIGLSLYKGRDSVSVQARSLKTAAPMGGVTVNLYARNHASITSQRASETGWANFSKGLFKGHGGARAQLITATTASGDFAFLEIDGPSLDLSSRGVSGQPSSAPIEVFLYSERGIYRPGESIHLGALVRDDKANALSDLPLTLTLNRPDGREVFRDTVNIDNLGGALVSIPISSDAPTGNWRVEARIDPKGRSVGELSVQVEEFVPERLEVKLSSDMEMLLPDQTVIFDVAARYLFGAPGAELSIGGQVNIERNPQPFEKYKNFSFGLPKEKVMQRIKLPKGETGTDGKSIISFELSDLPDSTAPLRAKIGVAVSDTDGRPSHRVLTIPINTHPAEIGLRASFGGNTIETGSTAEYEAIAVSSEGAALSNRELDFQWVREDRTYDWYMEHRRWKYRYRSRDYILSQGRITTDKDGRVKIARPIDRWGYYRLEVYDVQGGAGSGVSFRSGWQASAQSPDTPDALDLSIQSTDVQSGSLLRAFVKAPFSGMASVIVANSDILWQTEVVVSQEGTEVEIPVSNDWGAGAYVLATAFRPDNFKKQRGPSRAVGAHWFDIDQDKKRLSVKFEAPREVLPKSSIRIPFQLTGEQVGQERFKMIAFAVDEGILSLTRYKSPNPEERFLGQRRLGLDIRDIYGRLIAPLAGNRGQIRSGGDAAPANLGGLSKRVFKSIVLSSGIVDADAQGHGELKLDLPDFNGKLRLFAVVYGKSSIGSGETAFLMRDPLVAELLPPRFLAPGDRSHMALRINNLSAPEGAYQISVGGQDAVSADPTPISINLSHGMQSRNTIDIAGAHVGDGKLVLKIEGPKGFSLARDWDISVRPAQPWQSERQLIVLNSGENKSFSTDMFSSFVGGTGSASLSISSRPDMDVPALVTALDRYPYGCLEQTTSRALPLVYFNRLKKMWPGVTFKEETLDERINIAISRIIAKQRIDGSFGLWSSTSRAEHWLTAYAVDFLFQAKKQGATIPLVPLNDAVNWMKDYLSDSNNPQAKAYALYVLARESQLDAKAVRYHANAMSGSKLSLIGTAHVKAALASFGLEHSHLSLSEAYKSRLENVSTYYRNYGSSLRDIAAVSSLGDEVNYDEKDWTLALERLALEYESRRYTSTQEKASLLAAALKFMERQGDGVEFEAGGVKYQNLKGPLYKVLKQESLSKPFEIINQSQGPLRISSTITGVPADPLDPLSEDMMINRTYFNFEGIVVQPSEFTQGDRLVAVITGKSLTRFKHQALVVDFLPAGLEIEPQSISGENTSALAFLNGELSRPKYLAERDDRYVAAIDLNADTPTFKFAYVVRAVTPGTYKHPAVQVEDMYKPRFRARGKSGMIKVRAN